jgi:hypothetical protein
VILVLVGCCSASNVRTKESVPLVRIAKAVPAEQEWLSALQDRIIEDLKVGNPIVAS